MKNQPPNAWQVVFAQPYPPVIIVINPTFPFILTTLGPHFGAFSRKSLHPFAKLETHK